jgi:indole-3-glycerol phosphate synthase
MQNILKYICENKKKELEFTKSKYSLSSLIKLLPQKKNRNFKKLLIDSQFAKKNNLIAEIKKSSPSAGLIVDNYKPDIIASEYERSGVGAISILTENAFFKGNIDDMSLISNKVSLPILRKDFIIDKYQIYESKVFKADAILLITSILSNKQIKDFIEIADDIGLDCIIETHNKDEVMRAIEINYPIIGINNRNLNTLTIDTNNTISICKNIPKDFVIIGESGIKNKNEILNYNDIGIFNFLIGESILKSKNKSLMIDQLIK